MANTLQDLDITREELDKIGKALKNEEFRKLLVEYCEELADPASRKKYEEEITQLEKERGVEVIFINPKGHYVIKTSVDGNKLAFINVCSNDKVQKPTSEVVNKNGTKGINWSVPHFLSPPREDLNKNQKRCTVFDVIYHPDSLHLASKNQNFRDLINNMSCEAVEQNHNVLLDKTNLKFPKMIYKGFSRPLVIRKRKNEVELSSDDPIDKIYSDIYQEIDKCTVPKKYESKTPVVEVSEYATPKYIIKHRSDIDMQDFTNDMFSNAGIPKELVIEINLPLLKSSKDLELDVAEKTLSLISEAPAKYKLNLNLPYVVREDDGNAKFDQDQRKLTVTLPVKSKCNLLLSDIGRDDSGVESDNSPPIDICSEISDLKVEDTEEYGSLIEDSEVYRTKNKFLNPELHYSFPEYTCNVFNENLVFTLHVKNVDSSSVKKNMSDTSLHITFTSISTSYVPVNYAFYINVPTHRIEEEVFVEVWDNNVIVQIPCKPTDTVVSSYWAGTSEECSEEKFVETPSLIYNQHFKDSDSEQETSEEKQVEIQLDVKSNEDVSLIINPQKVDSEPEIEIPEATSIPIPYENKKSRSLSESSGEELGVSPTKGILKMGRSRTPVSRSVSESSADDYVWSSFENHMSASESLIPEEGEISSSMKKTVRFNDVVSRQLFRTNSSILGQKKKNQRKSRNKKRAQERRMSESENSEAEDKKDKSKAQKSSADQYLKLEDKKQDFKSDLIFDIEV